MGSEMCIRDRLQIDRTRFGEALLFARARRGSAVLTARATVLVNLALCVQVASEKFGHEKWSKEAVFLYQAAAAHLYVIEQDSANVVLLSMYTFHNLALLYYETLDYTECRVCLEGLWGVLCYGCIECPSLLSGRAVHREDSAHHVFLITAANHCSMRLNFLRKSKFIDIMLGAIM